MFYSYRLSGYAREFQIDPRYGDDRFAADVSFEEIKEIVEIDSKMRVLLLEQLSVVEIASGLCLRTSMGAITAREPFIWIPISIKMVTMRREISL